MTATNQEHSKRLKMEVFFKTTLYNKWFNIVSLTKSEVVRQPDPNGKSEGLVPVCKTLLKERSENVYWAIPFRMNKSSSLTPINLY